MKKIFAFILVACMAICGIVGCSGTSSSSAASSSDTASSSTAASSESASASASAASASDSTASTSASASAASTSASASSASTSLPAITPAQDVLIGHKTYKTDEKANNYSEYVTVYYGSDSNKLVGYVDETHFMKDAGYTQESLESANYEEVFPNLNSLSFAKVTVTDEGDYYCVMVTFKDLDDEKNVKAFIDSGIFTPDDGTDTSASFIDAESVMNHINTSGATEIPVSQQTGLHASI